MSLQSRISQLRNRRSKDVHPATTPDPSPGSASAPVDSASADLTRPTSSGSSDGLSEDWAEISSLDAISLVSSQQDAASSSTDEGLKDIPIKRERKSDLEETLVGSISLPSDTKVMKSGPPPPDDENWGKDERKVYEMQLETLQEQLVDIMIENQTLAQKLQKFENSDVIPLLKKLEEEREKNETLTQRNRVLGRHVKDGKASRQFSLDEVGVGSAGSAESSSPSDSSDRPRLGRLERLQEFVMERIYDFVGDFAEEGEEPEAEEKPEGGELTVKRLKENLKRFKCACDPTVVFFKAVSALVSWKSSATTFLAFIFYMYVVWRGWTVTVLLGMMLWYLTTTYFISMGWTIEFSLLPYHLIEVTPDEGPPLSMSDKFQLVLHVSRKVQNLLGHLADILEKLSNFLYWTNPELTKRLYKNLVVVFLASLFFKGSTLLTVAGLGLGLKIFLMNPVLERYPRLKDRYSFGRKMMKELPTNAELEQRRAFEETEQFIVPDIEGITIRLATEESHDPKPASKRWKTFSQSFNLPQSEQPLSGWEDGKRCTMITKNTRKGAFKNGRLYLTKSFLCFEKSRLLKEGNMIIPLKDVTGIEKAKPFGFLPGSGMSIEVQLSTSDKPIIFGGILNRNTVHEKITVVWEAAQRALMHQNNQQRRATKVEGAVTGGGPNRGGNRGGGVGGRGAEGGEGLSEELRDKEDLSRLESAVNSTSVADDKLATGSSSLEPSINSNL